MSRSEWMSQLEDAVTSECETERFESQEHYPPGERHWMVLTHKETAARAMVWFELLEKRRQQPVGVMDEVLVALRDGKDLVVAVDDKIRMRKNPS